MEQLSTSKVWLCASSVRQQSARKRRQMDGRVFITVLDLGKTDKYMSLLATIKREIHLILMIKNKLSDKSQKAKGSIQKI